MMSSIVFMISFLYITASSILKHRSVQIGISFTNDAIYSVVKKQRCAIYNINRGEHKYNGDVVKNTHGEGLKTIYIGSIVNVRHYICSSLIKQT
jgi:hypothetical protein